MNRLAMILAALIALAGCATYPGESERADARAAEHYDRVAQACDGKMVVKRTGSRIPRNRAYERDELLTARCHQ